MGLYEFLTSTFDQFIAFFPASLQWLAAVLVLAGMIGLLVMLIRQHILFIVLAILLLPFLIPIFRNILLDLFSFLRYLLEYIQQLFFGRAG